MRWLAVAAVTLLVALTLASAGRAAPCKKSEVAWGEQCWHVVLERAHFALWLDDRGVLDRFADRHRHLADRFGAFWPPRKPEARLAVRHVWPEHLWATAECVVARESGFYWRAFNGRYPDESYGLFQINMLAHRSSVPDAIRLFDPVYNARFAYRLYQRSGWAPWRAQRRSCGI